MKIVVLTGAGISAESGVPTFRDSEGLWEGHDVDQVATPEGFAHAPDLVHRFYDSRRQALAGVEPNEAHRALAMLEKEFGVDLLVVTQNIDDLHERAGSRNLVHMHGELRSALCQACSQRFSWDGDLASGPPCPGCDARELRPDVVWFGEMPHGLDTIDHALQTADLFVSVGTSGAVYPAAGFVQAAVAYGAETLELNLEPSGATHLFDQSRKGPAGYLVPQWVDQVMSGSARL